MNWSVRVWPTATLRDRTKYNYSLLPIPCSLFPISRLPTPDSRFPIPNYRLPIVSLKAGRSDKRIR
ncbi:MAG: hypothetical protein F6K50_43910 [Moorea sp. SIO3I7]|uniref:hypothetical protein n=1 Tax=unclassified Moorena TaxID=2683338 RepID=UPI0013C00DEE|nr:MULTISPECIES: hypothetical protein [unclassified Moorena]NEO02077.1 hypothetical protein [Moorena sp. SIO3I7]NEO05361.1 hypothetical protein [Moorena sp. SIO3I8]NEO22951.1 hypothetical protein [Moorena sp. SIO4A5]NEP22526.1 hypothetical protein [Moorena sp. SIO3I6]NEQ58233.1 hypothetical protein [Moorena sp. SIO4A1]